ncbi:SWIM zinc finger domain protein [Verrucomicrobiia bacterium DG1235]|nr:SWIM zinc finger domain protein [Verrucomicrobiae bacterium DG1235]
MDDYQPYVTAAQRKLLAQKQIKALKAEGYDLQPIEPFGGNKIAKSFWGHAWCRHLEAFSDYENRLPRGRSYLKNGFVCHLEITPGFVHALVAGSERYEINISITPLPAKTWDHLKQRCSGKIGSLIELLQGKLSSEVMRIVTDPQDGLFPSPKEIQLSCDCPDYADLCKHLAAVLYGIGRRLDDQPELLFTLRGVDQAELVTDTLGSTLQQSPGTSKRRRLAPSSLTDIFGVDLTLEQSEEGPPSKVRLDLGPDRTAQKPTPKSPPAKPTSAKTITTGQHVTQLRETFGMTEYEFAIIAEVSATTVRNWESKGPTTLRLRAPNSATLQTLAPLTPEAAWDRLNYLV